MRLLPFLALLAAPCLTSALPTEFTKPMPRVSKGFLENKGQVVDQEHRPNTAVRYLWEGSGYNVQLRHTGFSYDHYQLEGKPQEQGTDAPRMHPNTAAPEPVVMHMHRVDVELLGMNMGYGVETLDQLPGHFNFYTAGTPYGGATHVQHYGRVRYTEVYPGIDIEFVLDRELGFKYNVIAHPGADLGAVRMRITGPTEQHVEHGEVVMQTRFGEVREALPHSYWRTPAGEVPVEVGFVELGDATYGLKAASTAPSSSTLVVDPQPEVLWATFFGGALQETLKGVESMANGDVVLWGSSNSTGLGTSGAAQLDLVGSADCLFACFSATGGFNWATYAGGDNLDYLRDAAATSVATLTAVGQSESPNIFSIDSLMFNSFPYDYQAMIIHLNTADGSSFGGSFFGGPDEEYYRAITVAPGGGFWVSARTPLPNLGTPGTFDPVGPSPGQDGNLIRRYSSANILQWSTYTIDAGHISCTPAGDLWMASQGGSGGLIPYGILSQDGSNMRSWSISVGSSSCYTQDIHAFSDTNVVLLGNTIGNLTTGLPITPNALFGHPLPAPWTNGFILQLDTMGTARYATYWGDVAYFIEPEDDGGYSVLATNQSETVPGMATPFCDTTGTALFTRFNAQHLRVWSGFISAGGCSGLDKQPITGQYNVSVNVDDYTDSTSYQPTAYPIDDYSVAKFQTCTSNPLPPALGPVQGPSGSCSNTPVTYSVAAVPGVNYYFWQPPPAGSVVSGQGTPTAQIALGPIAGFVRVMAMDSCGIGPVSTLPVGPYTVPQISIAPTSPVYVCPGDSVELVATANGTVLWSNGLSGNSIWVPPASGAYSATVTTADGCTAVSNISNTAAAQLLSINITGPAQVDDEDTLSYYVNAHTGDISTQWSVGGGTFDGPSNTNGVDVHWTDPGLRYVAVHRVQIHNCDTYDTLYVQVNNTIGIQEQALVPLQVYPNPANTQVTMVPAGTWRPGLRYAVLNALGQEVLTGALPSSGAQPVELSTRNLSAGVYTLQTTLDGTTDAVVRLVVER